LFFIYTNTNGLNPCGRRIPGLKKLRRTAGNQALPGLRRDFHGKLDWAVRGIHFDLWNIDSDGGEHLANTAAGCLALAASRDLPPARRGSSQCGVAGKWTTAHGWLWF
jgi:hypothetical protein